MLVNGLPGNTINANDRGLMYGDGVFRTLLIKQSRPVHWQRHYQKLQQDCHALGFSCPDQGLLESELAQLAQQMPDGIAKIVITRGPATRGYAPAAHPEVTRILSTHAAPDYSPAYAGQGIKAHICALRLAHQPRLAGVKHLNRLENVLAAAEWSDPDIAEGILLDQDGNVIEGTRSNLFIIKDGKLATPDLSQCGVAGVQRDRVIEIAQERKIACKISRLQLTDLLAADEVFLVNSVIGLWPIREMPGYNRQQFPISHQFTAWLTSASN